MVTRGVARNLLRAETKDGSSGRAPVGSESEAPTSRKQMLICSYGGGGACPLGYATDGYYS